LEQIAENLTREGFSPIEEAEAFNKLLNDPKFSSSTKYLSSKLGKPEAYIKNKCDLLKFSNSVKKLVVSGTEIKKDRLTEEQLMPIKDLPIEHRDPLALIIAKDELPVSDVKKLARLFKDKDMSSGTKDKLLYKSGHELLQTWSVFEQNKAERAKSTAPKAAAAKEKPEKKAQDPKPVIPVEDQLQRWLTSFSEPGLLPPDALEINLDAANFLDDVNLLIENLEKHLNAWKKVRDRADNPI
jgi:ParB family chromosome partitioning protein